MGSEKSCELMFLVDFRSEIGYNLWIKNDKEVNSMTNEEFKKKLALVMKGNIEYELRYYPDDNYTEVDFDYDAIAENIIEELIRMGNEVTFGEIRK